KWASSKSREASRQVKISPRASAPVMKNSSASGRTAARSRSVSIVYVGPPRSMSTRDTVNRGLDAVATTVIRYRCSAGETTRSAFCHGSPVGTNTTSSRSNQACTSLAATKWPWWIGSKVPPITPTRRRPVCGARAAGAAVTGGSRVLATAAHRQQGDERPEQDHQGQSTDDVRRDAGTGLRRERHDSEVRHAVILTGRRRAGGGRSLEHQV